MLTFYKQIGSTSCDKFRGTFSGPGEAPGDWTLLKRIIKNRNLNISLLIVEFNQEIPEICKDKDLPFFTFNLNDRIIEYPNKKPSSIENILNWINQIYSPDQTVQEPDIISDITNENAVSREETINNFESLEEIPQITEVKKVKKTVEKKTELNEKKIEIDEKKIVKDYVNSVIKDYPWLPYAAALVIAAGVTIGVVAGTAIRSKYGDNDEDDIEPLLTNEDGTPINFDQIWEEGGFVIKKRKDAKETNNVVEEIPIKSDDEEIVIFDSNENTEKK